MPIDVPSSPDPLRGEKNFSYLVEACLACAVVTVDPQFRISSVNPHAEKILRLSAAGLLGQSIDLLPPPLAPLIRRTAATRSPVSDRHEVALAGAGNPSILQINTAPLGQAADAAPGILVVLNDLSPLPQWEASVVRLDRLHSVGTLSAGMAHEIKNAFVAVRTFVSLLLEQNKEADLAEIVHQEMDRIDSILSEMLQFSRAHAPVHAPCQIHPVLEKDLFLVRHLLEEKKIKVTRSFAASPDACEGDAGQLEQVFLNLFFNAVDALRNQGHLRVSTDVIAAGAQAPGARFKQGQPLLRVVVQDDGIGIPVENMGRLFEPFFTTKPEGTGLGLAITRRIIQDHRGMITAQSLPRQGTAFTLLLPAGAG